MKFKIFKEILTETTEKGTSYSQARVYLLWSIIAYYIILGIITIKSIKPDVQIQIETLKTIIEALQWSIALFSGYALGTKGLELIKSIFGKHAVEQPQQPTPDQPAPTDPNQPQ